MPTRNEFDQVAISYNDIRRALMSADYMSIAARAAFAVRCIEASMTYMDAPDTPAQNKENAVLRAFAEYLQETITEDLSNDEAANVV